VNFAVSSFRRIRPFWLLAALAPTLLGACDLNSPSMSEENCAAYVYKTFRRERAQTSGSCATFPAVADLAWESNDKAKCTGGPTIALCTYDYQWTCPGDNGETIVSRGNVAWDVQQQTGYGSSSITITDKDGKQLCQSTYDEMWAGNELAPAPAPSTSK
jgi:hypothetical protein